ncbi:MAG: hypothetical protein CM15mV4_2150 [Caudoviricetes sp.]|nr:MAG: hypothetical protein CM15mV4_2150 [Caudoviricetes sp.]
MSDIVIKKKNEVYVTVAGAAHIHHELSDYFSFEVPEAKFLKEIPSTSTGMERFVYILLQMVSCMEVC